MTATVEGVSATAGDNGTGPGNWPTNGTNTVTLPAGAGAPAAGDLILLPVFVRNAGQTINDTPTYTLLSGNDVTTTSVTAEIQGKIAGSSETNPTVTDSQTASQPTGALALTIRGWSGSLNDIVIPAPNLGASATIPFPDAVAPVDDCLVLRIAMGADDNTIVTPPAGSAQVFFEITMSGSDACLAIYRQEAPAPAGPVGTANLVMSGSDPYAAWTVVVPPGGEAPASAELSGALPDLTGTLTALALATGTASGTLPALAGALDAVARAGAALAGTLPTLTGSLTAAAEGGAVLDGDLPELAGEAIAHPHATAALTGVLPVLVGEILARPPDAAPVRAHQTATATAQRTAASSVHADRTATSSMRVHFVQTSGVN